MNRREIVVVGGSAGGVEAVKLLVSRLPRDFPAAMFVVIHFPPDAISLLPDILRRAGRLPATHARDGEPIEHGQIYVAPPDTHLLVVDGAVELGRGPRENGHRPAIDPLFRTAALSYGNRVIGVILSGTLDDGTLGLAKIKARGGVAVVQSPGEALYPDMPQTAIDYIDVDRVLSVCDISDLLVRLVLEPLDSKGAKSMSLQAEHDVAEEGGAPLSETPNRRPPSVFTCPECGGTLWESTDHGFFRYNCHVGHSYTAEALITAQADDIEAALWSAVRALEENATLALRMAERAEQRSSLRLENKYRSQAEEAQQRADTLRNLLLQSPRLALEG